MKLSHIQVAHKGFEFVIESEVVPAAVNEMLRFCQKERVKVHLSRNLPATSCLDASQKRRPSNGCIGIPLNQELKSLVMIYTAIDGQKGHAAFHLRGDQKLDFKAARQMIRKRIGVKAKVELLNGDDLAKCFGLKFGTVNPVLLAVRSDGALWQFFDQGVDDCSFMMTNSGDLTWAMEFSPREIAACLSPCGYHSFAVVEEETK